MSICSVYITMLGSGLDVNIIAFKNMLYCMENGWYFFHRGINYNIVSNLAFVKQAKVTDYENSQKLGCKISVFLNTMYLSGYYYSFITVCMGIWPSWFLCLRAHDTLNVKCFPMIQLLKTLRDSEVGPFCVPLSLVASLSWGKLCNLCVSHFKIL